MCIIILYNIFIIQYIKVLNSSCSINIFTIQKKSIIVMRRSNIDPCTDLFKKLKILPLQLQYMVSLLLLVVSNKDKYKANSEIHRINTRQNSNLNQTYQRIKKESTILASRSSTISLPIPKTCQ
jgi:hypothetical protein